MQRWYRVARRWALYVAVAFASAAFLFYPTAYLLGLYYAHTHIGTVVASYPSELHQHMAAAHEPFVAYDALPRCAVDGIVSVEDKRFFIDPGIDPIAVLRVAVQSFQHFHQDLGGSTLSQQLARHIAAVPRTQPSLFAALGSQWEVLSYAFALEHEYSKQTILDLYLNSVYYGRGAQGIASAAQAYFHTPLSKLSQAQCFYLAGLPQAPTFFGAAPYGAASQARYLHVLNTLVRNRYITTTQAKRYATELPFASSTPAH